VGKKRKISSRENPSRIFICHFSFRLRSKTLTLSWRTLIWFDISSNFASISVGFILNLHLSES
jgi:hypothetical protein